MTDSIQNHLQINIPEVLAEVEAAFYAYEKALTSNDIAMLDQLFWSSSHVIRLGASENLYGTNEIIDFREGRSPKNLDRTLRKTVITTFGSDYATANAEFTREGEARIGRQSHTWVNFGSDIGWKIVAAHVSWMDG